MCVYMYPFCPSGCCAQKNIKKNCVAADLVEVLLTDLLAWCCVAGSVCIFWNFQDFETEDPLNQDPKPNELIHFKIYSPNNSYYGIPAAVSAATAIVGDKFAKEYNIDYFENKAIPRYAIILKGAKLSARSKQELINYFRNEVKGRNHGTLVIPIPSSIGSDADIRFEKCS